MSHRIIIGSTSAAAQPDDASPVEYQITYAPPHDQPHAVTLEKVERLLKVARRIEEICGVASEDAP